MIKRKYWNSIMAVLLILAVSILSVSCQDKPQAIPDDTTAKTEEVIADDGSVVEAYLSIEQEKAIIVDVPEEIAIYQYRALPLFTVESTEGDGTIFGEQTTWKEFKVSDDGRLATMGYYRQGYWRFEIRALNKYRQVLYTGTTEQTGDVYLQKSKDNIIEIRMYADDGEGKEGGSDSTGRIFFAFETNWLSDSQDEQYVRLEVDKLTATGEIDARTKYRDFTFPLEGGTSAAKPAGKGWKADYGTADDTVTGYQDGWITVLQETEDTHMVEGMAEKGYKSIVPDGRIRFYASTPALTEITETGTDNDGNPGSKVVYKGGIVPGNYLVRAKVCTVDKATGNEIVIGGQSMAVKVVGGANTIVTGSLLLEKYQKTSLTITLPDNVEGEMVSEGTDEEFVIKSDNLTGQKITLTYNTDEEIGEGRLKYEWRLDGNTIAGATGRSFVYQPTSYGDHKITCIVTGLAGDSGNLGEISSVTMTVRVIEATGPNI